MIFVRAAADVPVPSRRRFLFDVALLFGTLRPSAHAFGHTQDEAAPLGPSLRRVRQFASARAARVVLRLDGATPFVLERARSGAERVVLHLPDVRLAARAPKLKRPGLVRQLALRQTAGGSELHLIVDPLAEVRAFYLPTPFRVVIDVFQPREAVFGQRDIARVALDPGHGGPDPGAVGPSGLLEKNVVLDIGHRAAPLLARELSVATLLTRAHDVRVPLVERVARANDFGADLFVSIHCNAHRRASASGTFTFVLAPGRDSLSQRAAALENGTAAVAPVGDHFANQFAGTSLARQSSRVAQLLQRSAMSSLRSYPRTRDGGVRGAGFYVLAGALMPAVLFETAFISNPLEEARLSTETYRQRLADSIVNAVRAYREGYGFQPQAPSQPEPRVPRR